MLGALVEDRRYNPFTPVRGKCTYWRERVDEDERWDSRVKREDRKVFCSCFVEGYVWAATIDTVEADCPRRDHCRYYVKTY
jgi:hypothetical protein